jgi:hypothetical protein
MSEIGCWMIWLKVYDISIKYSFDIFYLAIPLAMDYINNYYTIVIE